MWVESQTGGNYGRRLQSHNQNKHKLSLYQNPSKLRALKIEAWSKYEVELHLKSRAAVRSTLAHGSQAEFKAADSGSRADDATTTSRWKCLEVIPTPHLSW